MEPMPAPQIDWTRMKQRYSPQELADALGQPGAHVTEIQWDNEEADWFVVFEPLPPVQD